METSKVGTAVTYTDIRRIYVAEAATITRCFTAIWELFSNLCGGYSVICSRFIQQFVDFEGDESNDDHFYS